MEWAKSSHFGRVGSKRTCWLSNGNVRKMGEAELGSLCTLQIDCLHCLHCLHASEYCSTQQHDFICRGTLTTTLAAAIRNCCNRTRASRLWSGIGPKRLSQTQQLSAVLFLMLQLWSYKILSPFGRTEVGTRILLGCVEQSILPTLT